MYTINEVMVNVAARVLTIRDAKMYVYAGAALSYLMLKSNGQGDKAAREEMRAHVEACGVAADEWSDYATAVAKFANKLEATRGETTAYLALRDATDADAAIDAMRAIFSDLAISRPYHIKLWVKATESKPLTHERAVAAPATSKGWGALPPKAVIEAASVEAVETAPEPTNAEAVEALEAVASPTFDPVEAIRRLVAGLPTERLTEALAIVNDAILATVPAPATAPETAPEATPAKRQRKGKAKGLDALAVLAA